MTASQSLNSGDPIIPRGRIEWRDNTQFAVGIAISFLAGHALARALRTMEIVSAAHSIPSRCGNHSESAGM